MAIVTITPGSWQSVLTTTVSTAIQNQSPRELYITTESTGSLGLKEGFLLPPWQGVIIDPGYTVSASVIDANANVFHMSC
jgi:hypothetical protein